MIKLNKEETASFDVDPQNGFTPLCPNELPIVGGDEIADALNSNAKYARLRVGSKDAHPATPLWKATDEKPLFTPVDGEHADLDIHWTLHCVSGTFGCEFIKGLPPVIDYDFMVYKGMEVDMHPYGACYHDLGDKKSTGVIEYLKFNNIKNVIVGGLATDYCVATTAKQLQKSGLQVVLVLDSCRGISPEKIDEEIKLMKDAGILIVENIEEINSI